MCGLAGFWDTKIITSADQFTDVLNKMGKSIQSRGPDSEGIWFETSIGLGLSHRRLSIVDLSPLGHQPMLSSTKKSVLVYNGEIYNADELRIELQKSGIKFYGHSDTEVLLEGCEFWGVEQTVSRCIGMFAFAFFDIKRQRLSLVRDRIGIKPLYWGQQNGTWFFASQPKAIMANPDFKAAIDRQVMERFVHFAYVPASDSILKGIEQLRPGHLLHIDADGHTEVRRYWDLPAIARQLSSPPGIDTQQGYARSVDELESLLLDAVGRRMHADVPLGAFLSGGVDSSLVVALMQAQSDKPVRSFSIGFNEKGFNEAVYAAEVAKHLGTDHTELYVDHQQVLDLVPRIADIYDEPFADASQLPTQLLCAMTRKEVTIALSGDGGDELFAGYNRYLMAERIRKIYQRVPYQARQIISSLLAYPRPSTWDRLSSPIPGRFKPNMLGDKLHKLANILNRRQFNEVYPLLLRYWPEQEQLVNHSSIAVSPMGWEEGPRALKEPISQMQLMDMLSYLPDDILTKVDRASMDVSLEARVPLLDHRVVEFSWQLSLESKLKNNQGKRILRDVLYRYVPREMIERPKMGFGVPLDSWLRGPLKEWAEELLAPEFLAKDDLFNSAPIRQRWDEHLSGRRNWQYSLWNILMAQSWRHKWNM